MATGVLVVALVAVGLHLAIGTDGSVIRVPATADTYIDRSSPDSPQADSPEVRVGGDPSRQSVALLAFELPELPSGHHLASATLELESYSARPPKRIPAVEVTMLPTVEWDDTVTWNTAPDLASNAAVVGTHVGSTDDGGRLWIDLDTDAIQPLLNGQRTLVLRSTEQSPDPTAAFVAGDNPLAETGPTLTLVTSPTPPVVPSRAPVLTDQGSSLPQDTVLRINAGATETVTDTDGYEWQPDAGFVGDPTSTYRTDADITGTPMDSVFGTGRAHPVAYSFPMQDGCYLVRTHHAETDPDVGNGDRVVGIWVEGEVDTVDAVAEAGPLAAHTAEFRGVDVRDGELDIRFVAYGEKAPTVAGVEVIRDTACTPPAEAADTDVKRLVEDSVASGESYVRIPPGDYVVDDTIVVRDSGGVVIDATGAELTFTCTQDAPSGCSAFRFLGDGATLRGATIDFDPLPFTQGVVVDKLGTSVTVALDAGFPDVDWFVRESKQHQPHFDAAGNWTKSPLLHASVSRGQDSRTAVLSIEPTQMLDVSIGDRVALTRRGGANAIEMLHGDGEMRLEQVTIRSATGLGVYAQHWRGDVTLQFPTIESGPRPAGASTDRLISTSMDGLRWAVNRSGPTVYGADISRQGDDGINFHGYPYEVTDVESATSIVLSPVLPWVTPTELFSPGDKVRIMDADGSVTREVRMISDIEQLPQPDGPALYRVTYDQPADVSAGQIADIPEHNSPEALVRGSWFHDHVANGMRVKSDRWSIEGNVFEQTAGGDGVLVLPTYQGANWQESGWVEGLSVTDNVFRDIGGQQGGDAIAVLETDSSFNGHRDLVVADNVIDGVAGTGISIANTDGALVSGNRITGTQLEPIRIDPGAVNVTVEP